MRIGLNDEFSGKWDRSVENNRVDYIYHPTFNHLPIADVGADDVYVGVVGNHFE